MPIDAYEIARQHATHEITEINAQIEKLTHRKGLIDKLLELFESLDPHSASSDAPAPGVAEHQLPELQGASQGAQD